MSWSSWNGFACDAVCWRLWTNTMYSSNSAHRLQSHQITNSHTHILVWVLPWSFPGFLYCAYTYFWKQEEKKKNKVLTVSFIIKWRASSGFTQLYNEMILRLTTEEERMKCTYVLLCKMIYGWSDMWKQQNMLSSARISQCSYMFEMIPQYFIQRWMFNY